MRGKDGRWKGEHWELGRMAGRWREGETACRTDIWTVQMTEEESLERLSASWWMAPLRMDSRKVLYWVILREFGCWEIG